MGKLPDSFLAQERGFEAREREFRREMDILHSSTHNELALLVSTHSIPTTTVSIPCQVERTRNKLILEVLHQLQLLCESRHSSSPSSSLPPLCVYRIKVRHLLERVGFGCYDDGIQVVFDNEPGEGSGVLRSLFTAFAEAILSEDHLPSLEILSKPSKSICKSLATSLLLPPPPSSSSILLLYLVSYSGSGGFKGKSSRDRLKSSRTSHPLQPSVIKQAGRVTTPPEVEPALFFQPGKAGFYSPVQATPTPERMQAFRGVGRMIGLGLLLSEVFPLPLCRHVLKFILVREVGGD